MESHSIHIPNSNIGAAAAAGIDFQYLCAVRFPSNAARQMVLLPSRLLNLFHFALIDSRSNTHSLCIGQILIRNLIAKRDDMIVYFFRTTQLLL